MKMDLEQDPEFVAFMKNNNLNSEAIEYLKSKLLPGHEEMLETISSAATLVIRKAQQDALSGIVYEDENKPPASVFKAAGCPDKEHAPSTVAKSSSNVSAGSHVGTKKKMVRAVGDRPVLVKNKTKCTAEMDDAYEIPRGEVRLEVVDSKSANNIVGIVKFVKPLPESTKIKGQHAKIGRSTSEEYVNFGFSIQDDEVSTTHATIYRKNGKFYWKDASSTNGSVASFGNGVRDHMKPGEMYALQNGMQIELGMCVLKANFSSL